MKKIIKVVSTFFLKIKRNPLYSGAWAFALITVAFTNTVTKKPYSFVGVTTSKVMNVNLEHSVVIKSINVRSGEFVKKGQLLAELQRPDLNSKIAEAQARLEELVAQYKLNTRLNSSLKSIKKVKRVKQVEDDEDVLGIQIKSIQKELKVFEKEKEELFVFSQIDGHIGGINYKRGESVSPFEPIISLYHKTPTSIQGFIHERIPTDRLAGKKVSVTSLNGTKKAQAYIYTLGTRIVEFPERFKRHPTDKIWGREVMIQLPLDNDFLMGEKVFLEVDANEMSTTREQTRTIADNIDEFEKGTRTMTFANENLKERGLEPSGLTYMKDLKKFFMISDDNDDDEPLVYLLSPNGEVDSLVINMDGLKSIKDMETITMNDKGELYIIASQSENKKGRVTKERRLVVKAKREGVKINTVGSFSLFGELNKIAKKQPELNWVRLLKPNKKSRYHIELDVEGSFVSNGDLYLGLRRPLGLNKKVTILKISDIDKAIDTKEVLAEQVSIWRMISLPASRSLDRHEGISGMHLSGDKLYFTTANNKKGDTGRLFLTSMTNESLVTELARFSKHRPEGISILEKENKAYITFDSNDVDTPLTYTVVDLKDKK